MTQSAPQRDQQIPAGRWAQIRARIGARVHRLRHPDGTHSLQQSLRASGVVLGYLAIAYWLTGWLFPRVLRNAPDFNFYLAQPLVWGGLAVLAYAMWRRLDDAPRFSRTLTWIAFFAGVFHVGLLVIAGLVFGFGDSPIAGRLVNYPKNGFYLLTLLLGVETARGFVYHAWHRFNESLAFAGTAVVLFIVSVPAVQWTTIYDADRFFEVVGGRWAPALALSILATWLVRLGGIGPSFGYRAALLSFEWFSPVLPDLGWLVLLLVGVVAPIAAAELARSLYLDTPGGEARFAELEGWDEGDAEDHATGETRWWGLIATGAVIVAMVLFFTGAFGLKPFIISGISMEPSFSEGDVAVVRTGVDPESLRVDDVIRFRDGRIPVIHRIIAIEDTTAGRVFTTRGDNVARPDPPVSADQVEGKVVLVIPEVGKLKLWLQTS